MRVMQLFIQGIDQLRFNQNAIEDIAWSNNNL